MGKAKVLIPLLFMYLSSSGQIKNSLENSVFSFDNAATTFLKFSGGEIAIDFAVPIDSDFYNDVRSGQPSANKIKSLSLSGGIVNTTKFNDLDNLELNKKGFLIGISYKESFDEVFMVEYDYVYPITTYIIGAEYKMDNFRNFDPATQIVKYKRPITLTFKAQVTRYWFESLLDDTILSGSLSGSYVPKTFNSTQLLKFKSVNSADLINSDSVFAFKETDGKYGTVQTKEDAANLNAAIALLFMDKPILQHIATIGYFSSNFYSSIEPIYTTGFSINFLSSPIFGETFTDIKEDQSSYNNSKATRKFSTPSFLAVGMDWHLTGDQRKPNIFISGSISIN